MESFGKYLKTVRESKRWTRIQASIRINDICKRREMVVSVDSLEKWENDRVIPKIEPVKAMAITYGCPELIQRRLDAIELARKRKAACGQTQTTFTGKANSIN